MGGWIHREGFIVAEGGALEVAFPPSCSPGTGGCGACHGGSERRLPAALLKLESCPTGGAVSLRVGAGSLNRVAAVCFAGPLAALLAGAAVGQWLGAAASVDSDLVSAGLGLSLLGLALVGVARNGGAVLRMLDLDARLAADGVGPTRDPAEGQQAEE